MTAAPDASHGDVLEAPEVLEALVIGAGFSGICAAIKLIEAGITNIRIVDRAGGVGGTWWNNVYPGATCDIPSHFYCFSFEPNPDWSRLYSPQPEIQAYLERCVDKYGLRRCLDLGREIASLTFDDDSATWRVGLRDGEVLHARFVISGSGGLHKPSLPSLDGIDDFEGVAMHTATWDRSFDPKGKRIAVVGSAASAIQVVPAIAPLAAQVSVFQRTPNYIARATTTPTANVFSGGCAGCRS